MGHSTVNAEASHGVTLSLATPRSWTANLCPKNLDRRCRRLWTECRAMPGLEYTTRTRRDSTTLFLKCVEAAVGPGYLAGQKRTQLQTCSEQHFACSCRSEPVIGGLAPASPICATRMQHHMARRSASQSQNPHSGPHAYGHL